MTLRAERDGISVRAIRGARTILLAMDVKTARARRGLLGFAIGRKKSNGQVKWMHGFKAFEDTVETPKPGNRYLTFEQPIQSFQWGDYSVRPGKVVTYVVMPVRGQPDALEHGAPIELEVQAASESEGEQCLFFNRGAIPSQAFASKFGNVGPTQAEQNDPTNAKVKWLSRGLLEATLRFIRQARSNRHELRVAAYEFYYPPILAALKEAATRGATVRIVFDAGDERRDGTISHSSISDENLRAIEAHGLSVMTKVRLYPRTRYSAITHNKFMVLLDRERPIEVWTGSTNFTPSGFLGQSNVGHWLRNAEVAQRYNHYWELLAKNPGTRSFKRDIMLSFPDPVSPSTPFRCVFSPRRRGMMDWYADRFGEAKRSIMFTSAFGVAPQIAAKFAEDRDHLRFILMERRDRNLEEQAMVESDRDTRVALGERLNSEAIRLKLGGHALDEWFREEEHFRKRGHIFYVHTKYMLIDPLSSNPQIFNGSANFSDNSVENNDENMLLISGQPARDIAETFVAEYQRLFNHLYFRTVAIAAAKRRQPRHSSTRAIMHLDPTDEWVKAHFRRGTYRHKRRQLFS